MTNSNENPLCTCPSGDGSLQHPCPMHPASTNELKLGDVISVFSCHLESKNDWFVIRLCDQNDVDNYTNHIKQNEWQRGIHPSLIPDGFTLVEDGALDILNGNIETLSSNLYIAETAVFEQMSEIERLRNVVLGCAQYHQEYADKLKSSDPDRSSRQNYRAELLIDFANPKPEDKQS